MAHYAYLDENSVVTQVIVGKDETDGDVDWEAYYGAVRTSYNTRGGVHLDGGTPFRYNYAGQGYAFDADFGPDGAFIPPKPFASWVLDSETALWQAPVTKPNAEVPWRWDEDTVSWVEVSAPSPSWMYDLESDAWIPPVEYPQDGGHYTWDEETLSWVDLTPAE